MLDPRIKQALTAIFKIHKTMGELQNPEASEFDFLIDSFGRAARPATIDVREKFGETLSVLAKEASGGFFAEWNRGSVGKPIVFFGSEGQAQIAASNVREFLGLLAYHKGGWGLSSAMAHSHFELTALAAERSERLSDVFDEPQAPMDPAFQAVLTRAGVAAIGDLREAVKTANHNHLWDLIDTLDLHVTGEKVFRLWFEAWSNPNSPVRDYHPDAEFEVGEKVRYCWKYSWGEGTSDGLIIAKPAPNRVVIGTQHNTEIRVCAVPS